MGNSTSSEASKSQYAYPLETEVLQEGSVPRINLDNAMKDLHSRLADVYGNLGPDQEDQVGEAVRTMALIILDIEYVKTTKATGEDKEYSIDNVDPFNDDVNTMLKYFKLILERHAPEITQSCMAVLLVKMAQNKMTNSSPLSNEKAWKYTQLHHYMLLENIPIFKGKLLEGSIEEHFDDQSKICVMEGMNDKPLVPKQSFTGFVTKSPSSMINKMYCRRGKNKRNIIADQIRSRLVLESTEEVQKFYDTLQSHCYFHHKGLDRARAPEILSAHCELIQMMIANDSIADQYIFKMPKFHQETWFDCGPWDTLQLIPMRVKWNAVCQNENATDVPKNSVFNFNYYCICPGVVQSLEGLTMTAFEIQIGTKEAIDAMQTNHGVYDKMRIFHTNKSLEKFYNVIENLKPHELDAIDISKEEEEKLSQHFSDFPNLTLVMNEKSLKRSYSPPQSSPILTRVGSSDPSELQVFNYQGVWGANYPGYFVWRYENIDDDRLHYIKTARLWGSDQGWGTEGHCHCALVATRGDFQVVLSRKTLHHDIEEHSFIRDYRFDDEEGVVVGNLQDYDAIQMVIHSAPYPGENKSFLCVLNIAFSFVGLINF